MLRLHLMDDETYTKVPTISKRAKCGVFRTRAIVIREMARSRPLEEAAKTADVSVRHMLVFYDVHADVLGGSIYERKRGEEFLEFLGDLCELYPKQVRLYLVMDNFSPHKRIDMAKSASRHNAELVFTATNASWMNRIECHFGTLRRFALEGTTSKTTTNSPERLSVTCVGEIGTGEVPNSSN